VDVEISEGRFCAFSPASDADPATSGTATDPAGGIAAADGDGAIDGAGRIMLPSLGDVHAHLDSNRMGQTFRPHTADGTLHGLIMDDRENWRHGERGVAAQASYAIGTIIASGGTRIRSHAQVDSDCRLERFRGVNEALSAHADVLDYQIVALPQAGIGGEEGVRQLLDAALRDGADLGGGLDPLLYDRDPGYHVAVVFVYAVKYGKSVDNQLHETGTSGIFSLEEIVKRTKALSMSGQVTVSHAFALDSNPDAEVRRVLDLLDEAGIGLTTIAPSKGVLPQTPIAERRLALGLGADGQRDYWSPYGDGDLLRRTWQLAFTNGFRRDEDIEGCLDIASRGGAQIMAGARPDVSALTEDSRFGLAVGAPADFVLLEADTVTSAIMDCPSDRDVFRSGELIAAGGQLLGGARLS